MVATVKYNAATARGIAQLAEHFIPNTGTPIKVPSRQIIASYYTEVEIQIHFMLQEGIIEES